MQSFQTINFVRRESIAVIELNRPRAVNGLNEVMAAELSSAASSCDADASIKAVVLTASGRFFCAGGDVKDMAEYGDEAGLRVKRLADDAHRTISSFARMRSPLVVAVNGVTAGGGIGLAMAGDIVLAAESATFTMAYTNVGLSPDGGSTYYLPRLIGLRRTQELAFTNRCLTAREALDWNLVTKVVPDDQLKEEATGLAEALARGPSGSHEAIKQLLLSTYANGIETQMETEGRLIARSASSSNGQEGIHAFLEKRLPRFK